MQKNKLIMAIKMCGIPVSDISMHLGYSEKTMLNRINNDTLTVVDAHKLSKILKLNKPEEIFFG